MSGKLSDEHPLQASVEGDELVVRIGIRTLAFAAEHCELFYDGTPGMKAPYVTVLNPKMLARDVAVQLMEPDEEGSPAIGRLIDEMFVLVHDDGSEAFADKGDEAWPTAS